MKFSSMRASAPRDGSTMGQIPSILSGKGLREASDSSKPGECSELAPGHMAGPARRWCWRWGSSLGFPSGFGVGFRSSARAQGLITSAPRKI